MTRQRQWQLNAVAAGRCEKCGVPKLPHCVHCESCRIKNRETSRNHYRRRHGIPLDAPIGPQGRKRITFA